MSTKIGVLVAQELDVPNFLKDIPNFVKDVLNIVKDVPNIVKDIPNFVNDVPRLLKFVPWWGTTSNHFMSVSKWRNWPWEWR